MTSPIAIVVTKPINQCEKDPGAGFSIFNLHAIVNITGNLILREVSAEITS
jgi:hypothetical protein